MRLLAGLLFVMGLVLFCGCGGSDSSGPSGKAAKMYSYDFVRDVKAGEKLDMTMLRPMEIISNTVTSVDVKDLMLTSAEIKKLFQNL